MIKLLSRKIVFWQISKGYLIEKDKEIYLYAYEIFLAQVFDIIISFIIAVIMDQVLAAAIFLASYIPIRIYAGGNHAKTHFGCGIISAIIMICVCFLAGKLPLIPSYVFLILEIVAVVVILMTAPVADGNKPLNSKERNKCRMGTCIILAIEIAAIAICIPLSERISYVLIISNFTMAVSLMTGWLKNMKNSVSF